MQKIIVFIRGGCLTSVVSSFENIKVEVVDYDNLSLGARNPRHLKVLQKQYAQSDACVKKMIKAKKLFLNY